MAVFVAICVSLAAALASAQSVDHTLYTLTYKTDAPLTVGENAGTVKDLQLDLFIPTNSSGPYQLIAYVHGGAWFRGAKERLFGSSSTTGDRLLEQGFALASMSYRLSGEATFPAQIQDINDAINFLYDNAGDYDILVDSIAIFGGSAGGHLSSLIGTSNEHDDTGFYEEGQEPKYDVSAVLSIYGVHDFIAMRDNCGQGLIPNETIQNALLPCTDHDSSVAAEANLMGVSILDRPDLGIWVSPSTYVTENTPPHLLFHGSVDTTVYFSQSQIMSAYLNLAGVEHEYFIADGIGHGSPIFDDDPYAACGVEFLSAYASGGTPSLGDVCVGEPMRSGRVTVDTTSPTDAPTPKRRANRRRGPGGRNNQRSRNSAPGRGRGSQNAGPGRGRSQGPAKGPVRGHR